VKTFFLVSSQWIEKDGKLDLSQECLIREVDKAKALALKFEVENQFPDIIVTIVE
jgi:hypothetical protein